MGAWGPGGGGGGGGSESSGPLIGVGVKRQRVGECRPAVSLLLRRKGEESKPAEGTAADEEEAAAAAVANTDGAAASGGEGIGAEPGGLSMLAGYGSGSDAEDA